MRKLKLDPERLQVESFDVPAQGRMRGTVRAHESYPCPMETDYQYYTCGNSCIDMCIHTLEYLSCHCD